MMCCRAFSFDFIIKQSGSRNKVFAKEKENEEDKLGCAVSFFVKNGFARLLLAEYHVFSLSASFFDNPGRFQRIKLV